EGGIRDSSVTGVQTCAGPIDRPAKRLIVRGGGGARRLAGRSAASRVALHRAAPRARRHRVPLQESAAVAPLSGPVRRGDGSDERSEERRVGTEGSGRGGGGAE